MCVYVCASVVGAESEELIERRQRKSGRQIILFRGNSMTKSPSKISIIHI